MVRYILLKFVLSASKELHVLISCSSWIAVTKHNLLYVPKTSLHKDAHPTLG
jgi:hypothetical protein